ncbi:MAG: methyl-accepting chemotaxis protein [Magnetococcus sp. DMHC-6]
MDDQIHKIAEEIKTEFHREVDNVRHEMYQVRDLVQDAILKLTHGFEGIRQQANSQMDLVTAMTSTLEESEVDEGDKKPQINIRQFVFETDQILRTFVDHIILVSRQSMEMVHRVDSLSDQMEEIVSLLNDINTIAEQTNVLALNARIVAARAGQAGSAFSVVAGEVRKLSRSSNEFSNRIAQVVKRSKDNIENAKSIIEIMASKDMSFAIESKGRVDDMMSEVSKIDEMTAQTLHSVSEITEAINHSVGVAIMSLQFEDMVTQLSQSMEKKFIILDGFVQSLFGNSGIMFGRNMDETCQNLKQILKTQRDQFDEEDRKAVRQSAMEEGDIELF